MAANRSAFPKGKRRTLWETLVRLLQADPVLKRCVETWRVLDGRDRDPKAAWSLGQLPAVALSMDGRGGDWNALRDFKAPVVLTIDIAIGSTNYGDLLDFWEAIETVLWPVANPHQLVSDLRSIGLQGQTLIGPAVTPTLICDSKGLMTTGQVLFNFHRFV